jgi:hypothetical protein
MKKILPFLLVGLVLSTGFSQQGKYNRKSVSSLDAVWLKKSISSNINVEMITDFTKFYIEVPRFDFNNLPKSQVSNFLSKANATDDVTSEKLASLMEETIVKDIMSILNDPEVKKNRGLALKSESDFNTFAATKAKSLGLTTEELKVLMNSAYIYLPYISKYKTETKESTLNLEVGGGIIWWQVTVSPNGEASVKEVLNAKTRSLSSVDLDAKDYKGNPRDYSKFSFNGKDYKTTASTYIQGDAFLAFAKNLSVKTKSLSDFKLQAQIASSQGKAFQVGIGRKEGLFLDDGFFIVEMSENSSGEEVEIKKAFSRVAKTGDNREDSNNLTEMNKIYGEDGDVGQLILEHPTLGTDLRVRLGTREIGNQSGDPDFASEPLPFLYGSAHVSYNAAPIVNISQFYFDVMLDVATYADAGKEDEPETSVIAAVGFGAHKKLNFGRINVPLGAMYKYNSSTEKFDEYEYKTGWQAVELNFGVQYMLNQDLMVHLGYHMDVFSSVTSLEGPDVKDLDEIKEIYASEGQTWYDDLYKTSYLGIGIDYTLKELPVNIFGFLDPFKKY